MTDAMDTTTNTATPPEIPERWALPPVESGAALGALERAIGKGDLSQLSPAERMLLYRATCDSVGLNPMTMPFKYVTPRGGGLVLYATKGAAEQLRRKYGIRVRVVSGPVLDEATGMLSAMVEGTAADGRTDTEVAYVATAGARGEDLANLYMKCLTKAKRRLTLSLVGLGLDDVDEDGTDLRRVDPLTGEPEAPAPVDPIPAPSRLDALARAAGWRPAGEAPDMRDTLPDLPDTLPDTPADIPDPPPPSPPPAPKPRGRPAVKAPRSAPSEEGEGPPHPAETIARQEASTPPVAPPPPRPAPPPAMPGTEGGVGVLPGMAPLSAEDLAEAEKIERALTVARILSCRDQMPEDVFTHFLRRADATPDTLDAVPLKLLKQLAESMTLVRGRGRPAPPPSSAA